MIEILNGMHETINYGDSQGFRLYHNVEFEDYGDHWHTGIEIIIPVKNGYTVIVGEQRQELEEGNGAALQITPLFFGILKRHMTCHPGSLKPILNSLSSSLKCFAFRNRPMLQIGSLGRRWIIHLNPKGGCTDLLLF